MSNKLSIIILSMVLVACSPTIKVEAPSEPIVINLNIEHNIKLQIDKDLDDLLSNSDLF